MNQPIKIDPEAVYISDHNFSPPIRETYGSYSGDSPAESAEIEILAGYVEFTIGDTPEKDALIESLKVGDAILFEVEARHSVSDEGEECFRFDTEQTISRVEMIGDHVRFHFGESDD